MVVLWDLIGFFFGFMGYDRRNVVLWELIGEMVVIC